MFFILVRQRLVSHRKTLRLARLMGVDRRATRGRLIALWLWCLDHAPDGVLSVLSDDVDDTMLADVMGWTANMGAPEDLVDAVYGAGFIVLAEVEAQGEADDRWA